MTASQTIRRNIRNQGGGTLDAWQALTGISRLDLKIRHKEDHYRQILEDLTSIQAVRFDRASVCGGNNQTDVRVDELAVKGKELTELRRQRRAQLHMVEDVTDQIDDNVYVEVLMLYYIDGMTCADISDTLTYSRQHVYKILSSAEREYKRIVKTCDKMRQNATECDKSH